MVPERDLHNRSSIELHMDISLFSLVGLRTRGWENDLRTLCRDCKKVL